MPNPKTSVAAKTPVVYVVDDDPAVRASLSELLASAQRRVVCFESAEHFLQGFDASCPGCLLLDVRMPGMSGIELQERLNRDGIRVPVIVFTGQSDVPMSVQAMKQGAIDFLEKPYRPQQLLDAVDHATTLAVDWHRAETRKHELEKLLLGLTCEERLVMDGIVAGETNQKIASQLDVSLRTVQFRRTKLMKKLGVDDKVDLVRLVNEATPLAR